MHDRIRDVLPMGGEIDVRQVHGIEGYVTRGILFAASHDGDLLLRLDSESRMEALELSGATTWSPDDGAESYVIIPSYHLNSDETLRHWVNRALDYAEALGIEGEEDEMDDAFEEFEAPRSSFSDGPMDANGSTHDGEEDDMEGEEVRMPPPAPRPKPAKPVTPKPAPAAPAASRDEAAPKGPKPAPPKAAAAKKKPVAAKKTAAPMKKAVAAKKKAAPNKTAAAKKKVTPKKKVATPRKKVAAKKSAGRKPVKKAVPKKKAGPMKKAAPKKKVAASKKKPAPKKKGAAKAKPAGKKAKQR